jgi:NAD-dependent deacetylase
LSESLVSRDIRSAQRSLEAADTVIVLTGAGISADSGVPTFRGREGLWKQYRPEELATPEAFARDPKLVWEWYAWRKSLVATCRPNEAHLALARWIAGRDGVHIITQNVDGLHALAADAVAADTADRERPKRRLKDREQPEAGAAEAILELHGSLFRTRCPGCGAKRESREPVDASSESSLPRCHRCDTMLRPDVVWFGEPLDRYVLRHSFELAERAGACLVVGTSGVHTDHDIGECLRAWKSRRDRAPPFRCVDPLDSRRSIVGPEAVAETANGFDPTACRPQL